MLLADEFDDQTFENVIIEAEVVRGKQFTDCVFRRCTFREVVFERCRFRQCVFEECDLSLMRVKGSTFTQTSIKNSKAIGVNWAEAEWPKDKPLFPTVDFCDSLLTYGTFIGVNLRGARIVRCVAKDVDFAEADLREVACQKTDFSESRFCNTDLREADFTGATHYAIDAYLNKIEGATFSLPEAMALLAGLGIVLEPT